MLSPAITENELAQRWNISPKTLQRWRTENRGPRYYKLSKIVRYALEDIILYEDSQRQGGGDSEESPTPSSLIARLSAPVIDSPVTAPIVAETKRYTLREAFDLVRQHGSLDAAQASVEGVNDGT